MKREILEKRSGLLDSIEEFRAAAVESDRTKSMETARAADAAKFAVVKQIDELLRLAGVKS